MDYKDVQQKTTIIRNQIEQVIVGKTDVIDLMLTTLLAGGHVLLEEMPGTGKTTMAKALAKAIDGSFKRIQFTPDLLPSDITGLNYFHQKQQEFVFRQGPVFSNILLADEINRATPRTQSSLLECMEERQVTVDGETRQLDSVFFVIATQNPVETAGTFPLPEAQLDRFMMKITVGFPDKEQEIEMVSRMNQDNPLTRLEHVCGLDDIEGMRMAAQHIFIHESIIDYIVSITQATRDKSKVLFGASPRSSIVLTKCAKAYAAIQGRNYVLPDDVKYLAPYVLSHRIMPISGFGTTTSTISFVEQLLSEVPVPVEAFQGI